MLTDRVFQSLVVFQQRRCSQKLQSSQTGVSDHVNQGDVAQSATDFDSDDSHLSQRREGQCVLDVRLHS